jgi:hypothetical protein
VAVIAGSLQPEADESRVRSFPLPGQQLVIKPEQLDPSTKLERVFDVSDAKRPAFASSFAKGFKGVVAGLVQGSAERPPQLPAQCIYNLGKDYSQYAGNVPECEMFASNGVGGWRASAGVCGKRYSSKAVAGKRASEGGGVTVSGPTTSGSGAVPSDSLSALPAGAPGGPVDKDGNLPMPQQLADAGYSLCVVSMCRAAWDVDGVKHWCVVLAACVDLDPVPTGPLA